MTKEKRISDLPNLYICGFGKIKNEFSIDHETLSHSKNSAIKKCKESFSGEYSWQELKSFGRKVYKIKLQEL